MLLRAVRFAAKLDMTISPRTAAPIRELAPLLQDIPAARLFEGDPPILAGTVWPPTLLQEYGLFQPLFPGSRPVHAPGNLAYEQFIIEQALMDTDTRVREERVTPRLPLRHPAVGCRRGPRPRAGKRGGLPWYDAFMLAINEVLDNQVRIIAVPRRFTTDVRDIWALQQRLTRPPGQAP